MPITEPDRFARPEGWRESPPEIAASKHYLTMGNHQIRKDAPIIKAVLDQGALA